MDYPSNAASSPRNDSLLRTTLALQHLAHVTTRCYGLANRSTHLRLTQRTVKNRDIDLPTTTLLQCSPRITTRGYGLPQQFSPRNDSLLRTALALQRLAHVTTRCYELATTTRPYQRNVKTGTSIYQRPTSAFRNNSTDLSCPRPVSNCIQRPDRSQLTSFKHPTVSPRLDLRQLPLSNVQLRTSTTRPYQLTT